MKASHGFSLVEVLTVSALMTMLLGALYPLLSQGMRDWYNITEQTELRNGANLVIDAIQRDLLKAVTSADGQDAIYVSNDHKELKIVTEWESGQSNQPATPKNVIIYTFHDDPQGQLTKVYRYVGSPSQASDPGMQLVVGEVDFTGSSFERQSNGRILVELLLKGPRKNEFKSATSLKYIYGS